MCSQVNLSTEAVKCNSVAKLACLPQSYSCNCLFHIIISWCVPLIKAKIDFRFFPKEKWVGGGGENWLGTDDQSDCEIAFGVGAWVPSSEHLSKIINNCQQLQMIQNPWKHQQRAWKAVDKINKCTTSVIASTCTNWRMKLACGMMGHPLINQLVISQYLPLWMLQCSWPTSTLWVSL